jgi:drug/metabolite transporter (DMT)-like permease
VIFATTPFWTALFASIEVGESLDPNELIGGAIIIIAVLMAGMDQPQVEATTEAGLSAPDVPSSRK